MSGFLEPLRVRREIIFPLLQYSIIPTLHNSKTLGESEKWQ